MCNVPCFKNQNGAGTDDNWRIVGNDTRTDDTTPVALTDASDGDAGTWDSANEIVNINLGNLSAGTSAYVEFKVKVK